MHLVLTDGERRPNVTENLNLDSNRGESEDKSNIKDETN